ncbi:MAG TPA: rhomboid family intramembrane serine protease [Chitinophagaceae bacterium]
MSEFKYHRPSGFPPIIKNLIIINVLVWVAQLIYDKEYNLTSKLALWPVKFPQFEPYQIATHMFAHGDVLHIFFNMFSLYLFGRMLENLWGPKRFLFFYLACGIGAAALHMLIQYIRFDQIIEQTNAAAMAGDEQEVVRLLRQIGPALGASGAIMGVVIAFAYLFPNTEFTGMFLPITIKAKWLALIWVAGDLFGGISNTSEDNIAHFAHLGGAITGFIIVYIWNKTNRKTLY